jgi:hypothetical protein
MAITRKSTRKKSKKPSAPATQNGIERTLTLADLIAGVLASQAASISTPSAVFSARLELSEGELVRDFDVFLDGGEIVIALTDVHRDDMTEAEPDRIQGR